MPDHWLNLFEKRPQNSQFSPSTIKLVEYRERKALSSIHTLISVAILYGHVLMAFITLPARPTYILFCPQVSALCWLGASVYVCVGMYDQFDCQQVLLMPNIGSKCFSFYFFLCVYVCVVAWGPFDWMPHHNCGIRFISCWYVFDMWPTFSCGKGSRRRRPDKCLALIAPFSIQMVRPLFPHLNLK